MATLPLFTLRQYYDWCKEYQFVIHDYIIENGCVEVKIKISILEQLYASGYKTMNQVKGRMFRALGLCP